jgi:uncharacterized protein
MEIVQTIERKLSLIESDYLVKVLYACETGSRAWGFPSPDSDYDVRFIYVHDRDWYLQLNSVKDTIEVMDGDLDVSGWDLRKCLHLLKKSNAPLIERFQSPVLYYDEKKFRECFMGLIRSYYSPIAVFYHHYSLAKKFYEDFKGRETVKLKSYFYLLRSLLSCNWIINDNSVLPMEIGSLMKYSDDKTTSMVLELIGLKSTVGEKYLHPVSPEMINLVEALMTKAENAKDNLAVNNEDYGMLNTFFLNYLENGTYY